LISFERTNQAEVCAVLSKYLKDTQLIGVERREQDWFFDFASGMKLTAFGPWRILANGQIALASDDDGQKFGHPAAIVGESLALKLLGESRVHNVSVRDETSDLVIVFYSGAVLVILNMSMGYEGWWVGMESLEIVAQGGGQLAISTAGNQTKPK
jgi:hypothetical protein